jgi:ATP-dependent DNA helicase RecG
VAITLEGPVTALRGVGPALEEKLSRLGITSPADLLYHLPFRYQDRTRVSSLGRLQVGEECLIQGEVVDTSVGFGRRRSWTLKLSDDSGFITLRFFHFNRRQQEAVQRGMTVRCFGEVRFGPAGLEMAHPEYKVFSQPPPPPEPVLAPIYRTTDGLTQQRLRDLVGQALSLINDAELPDLSPFLDQTSANDGELNGLPTSLLNSKGAIALLHSPPPTATPALLAEAREHLALEELTANILAMKVRQRARHQERTIPLPSGPQLGRELMHALDFELTGAQKRVLKDVLVDLTHSTPMLRLIQGDVGSGKTVIAAFAAIRAAEHGQQTAFMAPTEILAEQHYQTLSAWLEPLGISVRLLTGRMPAKQRRTELAAIADGGTLVAVGTHALFQGQVGFASLALTIIDEQHRFGVHQRMALRDKGRLPHQLVMTATPIPRTLTMAMYADMDVSVIDELPKGRRPVTTSALADARRDDVIARISDACAAGRQAYWVCTLIEESDTLEFRAAETTAEELCASLPHLRLALIHGRLSSEEKSDIMARFKAGEVDLLVATTVIEVGVDVPNATIMVIENPERLGLAQLHQLRGRVGRGQAASHCVLLYKAPLSEQAQARLNVMRDTNDGFKIAEEDLKLRGPGDVLGTRQTGDQAFRIADLMEHAHLIPSAAAVAGRINEASPQLAEAVMQAWSPGHLGYAEV